MLKHIPAAIRVHPHLVVSQSQGTLRRTTIRSHLRTIKSTRSTPTQEQREYAVFTQKGWSRNRTLHCEADVPTSRPPCRPVESTPFDFIQWLHKIKSSRSKYIFFQTDNTSTGWFYFTQPLDEIKWSKFNKNLFHRGWWNAKTRACNSFRGEYKP